MLIDEFFRSFDYSHGGSKVSGGVATRMSGGCVLVAICLRQVNNVTISQADYQKRLEGINILSKAVGFVVFFLVLFYFLFFPQILFERRFLVL